MAKFAKMTKMHPNCHICAKNGQNHQIGKNNPTLSKWTNLAKITQNCNKIEKLPKSTKWRFAIINFS
jgi:hypothetical protein